MQKTLVMMLSVVLIVSCTSGAPKTDGTTTAAAPAGVPDSEIGLAPGTAFEQPQQRPIVFNSADPGDSDLKPRSNAESPPVIPHSIADLETITLRDNSCLDCHDPAAAPDMGAPAVPPSHLVDLRRSPEATGTGVVGARRVCTSCHVAQTETEPLVANASSG